MRFTLFGLLVVGLSSCRPPQTTFPDQTDLPDTVLQTDAQPVSQPISSTDEVFTPLPGRYCYVFDDGITTSHLRLTLDAGNRIQGDARSSIQNDESAYYTSHAQVFSGNLTNNDQTTVDITTWIEYDVQDTTETWTLTNDELITEKDVLTLTDCGVVNQIFQDQDGLEASDLTDGATVVHTRRVEFAPGRSSADVSNSIVRGERDVHLLGASGGQQMTLLITSLEDNAVFDVVSPSGYILTREAVNTTLLLPHTGDYQVIVGGTRGNTSYELKIGIQ